MGLKDPVSVYLAANNDEARQVREICEQAGIEAYFTQDVSTVGLALLGPLSGVHDPRVWVEREDAERARAVVQVYEDRLRTLRGNPADSSAAPIDVECEDCGRVSSFAAALRGSVQECPHCLSYVDVGDMDDDGAWAEADEDSDAEGEFDNECDAASADE